MNKYTLALAAIGIFSGVACTGTETSNYTLTDSAKPMTLDVTGMT